MTQITPEEEIALGEGKIASLTRVIIDLRNQIEALTRDAETGGKIDQTKTKKALSEINAAVMECTKAEHNLDECRNTQAGIARGGDALDFEKARAEIGCKLDQLRKCHNPREVFE